MQGTDKVGRGGGGEDWGGGGGMRKYMMTHCERPSLYKLLCV